jgi:hypothetical protein
MECELQERNVFERLIKVMNRVMNIIYRLESAILNFLLKRNKIDAVYKYIGRRVKNSKPSNAQLFEFKTHALNQDFSLFFKFCQQNLFIAQKEFRIRPAFIFFSDHFSVNGRAGKINGVYIIDIHSGLLEILKDFFFDKAAVFNAAKFNFIRQYMDVTLPQLLFQLCTIFTYYHERAHLIQRSSAFFTVETEALISGVSITYSEESHAREFDADLEGSYFCALHILEYFKKLPENARTTATLTMMISLTGSAIFTYFLYLSQGHHNIYYYSEKHPHPMIRLTYLIDSMLKSVDANNTLPINQRQVVLESIALTDTLYTANGNPLVQQFAHVLFAESNNIELFVNDLIAKSAKYPNLVMNRKQK